MLNRADELAARDNYHGEATWRRIIEAVGQLVNKTLPGALHYRIDDRKFRSANPIPGPPAGFILDNSIFSRTERQGRTTEPASFMRGPETIHTRVLQGFGFRCVHVLGTNADPNQPGRNAAQHRKNRRTA